LLESLLQIERELLRWEWRRRARRAKSSPFFRRGGACSDLIDSKTKIGEVVARAVELSEKVVLEERKLVAPGAGRDLHGELAFVVLSDSCSPGDPGSHDGAPLFVSHGAARLFCDESLSTNEHLRDARGWGSSLVGTSGDPGGGGLLRCHDSSVPFLEGSGQGALAISGRRKEKNLTRAFA